MRPEATDQPAAQDFSRRALILEYATIGWNVGEAVLTITLGSLAGSVALLGFGTVSVVEVFASSVVVWHLRRGGREDQSTITKNALRLIAVSFLVLAGALIVVATNDLVRGRQAEGSPWGIAYLSLTALVMFGLASMKRRTAEQVGSEPLKTEATVTFLDGILSVTTLVGLALNAYLGWWWADPVAGVLVGVAAVNEARETWEESHAFAANELA